MTAPANMYPGLNDIHDCLEEIPLETSRYFTLLHEIEAKCTNTVPELHKRIDDLTQSEDKEKNLALLKDGNRLLEESMAALEEKMHVSALLARTLEQLNYRLELAYEVALKNDEIPEKLRIGVGDKHPAMHLHHELISKATQPHSSEMSVRSEARREAIAAQKEKKDDSQTKKTGNSNINNNNNSNPPRGKKRRNKNTDDSGEKAAKQAHTETPTVVSEPVVEHKGNTNEYGEPLYCYCQQVAYGEMVGCDGATCALEWFHLPCIGLTTLPKGKWYCQDCQQQKKKRS